MKERQLFVPYPAIQQHGMIGDRRTAALIAADGTLDWLCLPDYDGVPYFGALLDTQAGGFWRIGPVEVIPGKQRYHANTALLLTTWSTPEGELELTDVMAAPEDKREAGAAGRRVILRQVRCLRGAAPCTMQIMPRRDFQRAPNVLSSPGGLILELGDHRLGLWSSHRLDQVEAGATATFTLRAGETAWTVLALDEAPANWTVERARTTIQAAATYWRQWIADLSYTGPRGDMVRRSALTVHLLSYAPTGSLVAAPTTSLPERIGGDRNYDYRYAWVRDASLSLAALAMVGNTQAAERYMDWLAGLDSSTDSPLQVVYGIRGATDLTQRECPEIAGYRDSRPVRIGNHAYSQRQLDSLGYLAECALIYVQQGGPWREEYWALVRRIADYAAAHWREADSGIWELPGEQHYVSSKVMSWVTLERAVRIAEHVGRASETASWQATMEAIHAEVMERGWSERLRAFRQRYDADTLDAAALLIPVMDFLPADHPRVAATVERIVERLTIDGLVHRFVPRETLGHEDLPVGEFEGAFLPCTFWLATTYAKAGHPDEAEAILQQAEAVAGELGLFAEEVDARRKTFLGNTPLLFTQVEYVRAVVELARARPLAAARMMVGKAKQRISRFLSSEEPEHTP